MPFLFLSFFFPPLPRHANCQIDERLGPDAIQSNAEDDDVQQQQLLLQQEAEVPSSPISSLDAVVARGTITRYHVAVDGLLPGHQIVSDSLTEVKDGNCMRLKNVPLNTKVCLIELTPGCGAKLARAAGQYATVVRKVGEDGGGKLPTRTHTTSLAFCRDREREREVWLSPLCLLVCPSD